MRTRLALAIPVIAALLAGPAPAGEPPFPAPERIPLIGETAPSFTANTTEGKINFPESFQGKWVILFSHPADFTPVCTTELMTFQHMRDQFDKLNCALIGLSVDSNFSHIAWLLTIRESVKWKDMENIDIRYPVIADVGAQVAAKYGMIHPSAHQTEAVRAVFVIDPDVKVRAILYYPLTTGRNFEEIKRLLIALQTADAHNVATPADWQPGDDVIVPPPGSCGAADERLETAQTKGYYCLQWFLCFRPLPKALLNLP